MDSLTTGFTEEDGDFLIQVVKAAQQRKIVGAHGKWPDYLKLVVDKSPRGSRDPAKRSWNVLANFVASFTKEEDKQMVEQMMERRNENSKVPWPPSPEQELVRLTQRDPTYSKFYSFPSNAKNWVIINEGNALDATTPERLLSLDCEMGIGEDNEKHILKFCVVDRDCQVLVDTLVKPHVHIKDYLTAITGVKAADLEGCTFSLADAQQKLQELLQPGTILVGHSLCYDLKVLQVDYPRLIDTYLIFKTTTGRKCGLDELCQAVLGYSFREEGKAHDCLLDALIPMRLVNHVLEHGVKALELPEQTCMGPSLLLHKLPLWTSPSDLLPLFPSQISCDVKMVEASSTTRNACANFQSVEHAHIAFHKLTGKLGKDTNGLPQKQVKLWSTEPPIREHEIYIRKVRAPRVGTEVVRAGNLFGGDQKPGYEDPTKKRSFEVIVDDKEEGEIVAKQSRGNKAKRRKSKHSRCIAQSRSRNR